MKLHIKCGEKEEETCPNRLRCIDGGVVCVHLILGFRSEIQREKSKEKGAKA